jgi:hypothetical protein
MLHHKIRQIYVNKLVVWWSGLSETKSLRQLYYYGFVQRYLGHAPWRLTKIIYSERVGTKRSQCVPQGRVNEQTPAHHPLEALL